MNLALKPLNVGDLIVVKQRLARYEYGEIAHVENVMATEQRSRSHRRLRQLETRLLEETEREEERRDDLETTERFEVETEIKRELKREEKFSAGLEVSGGFGPVNVSAYAKYDRATSEQESKRTAQQYAKEITAKAMERIKERVRTEREQIERLETEEINKHRFVNETLEHVTGVYRWVDKYYEVTEDDYGKRLFYEVVVPEPAVLLVFTRLWSAENRDLPTKPEDPVMWRHPVVEGISLSPGWWVDPAEGAVEFPGVPWSPFPSVSKALEPSMIDERNYRALASIYAAEGIKPPPSKEIVVTHSFGKEVDHEADWVLEGEGVRIPDDYEAVACQYVYGIKAWLGLLRPGDTHRGANVRTYHHYHNTYAPYTRLQLGTTALVEFWGTLHGSEGTGTFDELNRERHVLPITGTGDHVGTLTMNIEVTCERTTESFQRWQMETYNAVMSAYKRQVMEYEEQLAAASVGGGVQITGENPEKNLLTIKTELKRQFLRLWMGGDLFDLPAAVSDGDGTRTPPRFPETDRAQAIANADTVAFAEEAFDWDNISFRLLPYFHGREEKWVDLSGYTDPDPVFENFLKAGAALVRIPAVPEYTHAILYYQLTGELWPRDAGDVPALSDVAASDDDVDAADAKLYNGFLNDVDAATSETDVHRDVDWEEADTFEVKVPTSLVALQGADVIQEPS